MSALTAPTSMALVARVEEPSTVSVADIALHTRRSAPSKEETFKFLSLVREIGVINYELPAGSAELL